MLIEPSIEMLLGLLAGAEVHCCIEAVEAHQAGSDYLLFGDTRVWDCPKEISYRPGGPYTIVVTEGDPHIEIVADNDTSAARLEGRWGDARVTRHDPVFDLYLNVFAPGRKPQT